MNFAYEVKKCLSQKVTLTRGFFAQKFAKKLRFLLKIPNLYVFNSIMPLKCRFKMASSDVFHFFATILL